MALELRKKNGKYLPFFYGRYYISGKSKVFNTGVRWKGTPPESIKEAGDASFEQSRQKAEAILRRRRDEARAQIALESRPSIHWATPAPSLRHRDLPINRLLPENAPSLRGRVCSPSWTKWKLGVKTKFLEWAEERGIATVRQITRSVTAAYIEHLHAPDAQGRTRTAKTIRSMKTVLAMALARCLTGRDENPFKAIQIEARTGDRTYSRVPLDAKEVERLLAVARDEPMAHDLIVTGLCTGLRRGDVCHLRWANIDLKQGVLTIQTSKTQASLYLPILPKLREVLGQRLDARQTGEIFVFSEAESMLRENPGGITWRIKKVFTLAFAPPDNAGQLRRLSREKLRADLDAIIRAVQNAQMPSARRKRMIALLHAYAEGCANRLIQERLGISRGTVTNMLREAERLSERRFLPGTLKGVRGITAAMKEVTQTRREIGVCAASKYDFHALRTTFVTLAINGGISIDKLRALTGHKTVDIVLKHYFKPKGTDVADDLEKALPGILTKTSAPAPLAETCWPEAISPPPALQQAWDLIRTMSPAERALLKARMGEGGGWA